MEVWETNEEGIEVTIKLPNGIVKVSTSEVTAQMVKDYAAEAGISRFNVLIDGVTASSGDFPVSDGEIVISEYNEAK